MKMRAKLSLMVGIPIIATLVVFIISFLSFLSIGETNRYNSRLNDAHAALLNGDRDAYQAVMALLQSQESRSQQEAQQFQRDYQENRDQALERVVMGQDLFTLEMQEVVDDFQRHFEDWDTVSSEILKLQVQVADQNQSKIDLNREAMKNFDGMRDHIDELGRLVDQALGGSLSLARRRQLEQGSITGS